MNMGWVPLVGVMMSMMAGAAAQETATISLPPPETSGGMPLMQALMMRHSTREFSAKPLPPQVLANLLWAAGGVNRPDTGKRTAPSARDWREVEIYLATAEGAFRYDPPTHTLIKVADGDLRALTGMQDFVATAPLNLVYVADLGRMSGASDEDKARYSAADTGFMAQNVYLYGASAGLAVVVRGMVDREALGAALGLRCNQRI
ncbi:MAG: SagB/ThcOx family dehydrogenase, partial [Thiobacillus sp.]